MRILLIEDNPGDARLVQEILSETPGNFTINVVDRLGLGLKFLASQDVDVVLLDLNLPDSRGLETLTRLRAGFSHLPVVIMTGSNDEAAGVQAVKLGAQDYLVKGQVDSGLLRRALSYAVERKKADEASKDREHFLKRLTELNPAVVSVTDLTNNQQIYSSKPGLALLGYRLEEIEDIPAFSLSILYPGDLERMVAASAELKKANDDRIRSIEVRAKAADGTWRWFQILYVIFKRDHNGLPLQSMSVARDVTEHKDAEQELERRTRQLEAANSELEAFSYSVSHDLRAPLRSLDGFSQIVLEDYGDRLDEQGQEYLQKIKSLAQLMAQLTDDMLKLSRIGRAEMKSENVCLSDLAQSIAEELKRTHPKREAEFVIQPGICACGDGSLLKILLQNLLANAWKYTSKRTAACIEFRAAQQTNGDTVYSIKDNGVGFDMTYADKLFKPFHRLHSEKEFPGTGIGLAIVQRVVHRHGGRAWAEAEVGKGATFYFTLKGSGQP